MLTKLLPDQVAKFWDVVKFAIEESLPPIVGDHPDKMSRILGACLSGSVDVWASYIINEEVRKFEGILLTKVLHDDASGTNNLLLYCVYGYSDVSKESWISGFESILKYAKNKHCMQVVAYTEVPYLIDLVKSLGGDAKYTFVSFNVNTSIKQLEEFKSEDNN